MSRTIETVIVRRVAAPVIDREDADRDLSWLDDAGLTGVDALRALGFIEACRS